MATFRVRSSPGLLLPAAAAGRAGPGPRASFARASQCALQIQRLAGLSLKPAAVADAMPTRRRRRSHAVCGGAQSVASTAVEADQDIPFTGASFASLLYERAGAAASGALAFPHNY